MKKKLLVLLIFLISDSAFSCRCFTYQKYLIENVSSQKQSLCIGDKETRYFIRLNKIETNDSFMSNLKRAVLANSDTVIRLTVSGTSKIKEINGMYEDWKLGRFFRKSVTLHGLYDDSLQVVGIWAFEYTGTRMRSKSLNTISKKIFKNLLKMYPLGEYLGKQKLNCLTKTKYDLILKSREAVFWEWFKSRGQILLETDGDCYFKMLYDALQSVGSYLTCKIEKERKCLVITGDKSAIDRLQKYEPEKLYWRIQYNKELMK